MPYILGTNTNITLKRVTKPLQFAADILRRDLSKAIAERVPGTSCIIVEVPERENPFDEGFVLNVKKDGIHLQANSSLGGVYGLLYISREFLGINPFWFWLDCLPEPTPTIQVPFGEYTPTANRVRFRGWFLNDEVLLTGWKPVAQDEEYVWRMAFETLMRCGGNMVIPGTDHNSVKNRRLAAEMGLWITHHHAEPLGAPLFARVFPGKQASYTENGELFRKTWQDALKAQAGYNVVWALGFRGQGDRPFWADDPACDTPEKRGEVMSRAICDQHRILKEENAQAVCCINLYGEVLELYRDGLLELPEDVICIWADSGYGKMVSRRQNAHNPRVPALPQNGGANGIYYHASFYDLQASSHITMLPNPPEMICTELERAFSASADDYLIVNCGNIRPHVYVLDLIANLWHKSIQADEHLSQFVNRYFAGNTQVAGLLKEFSNCTLQYGKHADEKAGEQIYHHPARELVAAWMAGETQGVIHSLVWLCGEKQFPAQLEMYEALMQKACESWIPYLAACTETKDDMAGKDAQRFFDFLGLQALLHTSGAQGAAYLCKSWHHAANGYLAKAYCCAWLAKQKYAEGITGFGHAEHDIWRGYYSNDCLTDVRSTVDTLDTLVKWLRSCGEGADKHTWHRQYLLPLKDKNVMLLTNFERPLTDNDLAPKLCSVLQIK